MSAGDYRVNEQIRGISQVRLIVPTKDGKDENIGVVSLREALGMASDRGLDLVEVAPNANPPVCRIMDFSKFLYERSKKEREARKAQKVIEVKEIQLQLKTSEYHAGFKINNARKWLNDGMKVKVRIQFHGREIDYRDIARDQMDKVVEKLQDVGIVESPPKMDGRAMIMVLAPASMAKELAKEKEQAREAREVREPRERRDRNPQ
ncbi:MAG: translation initiation factor IF-3 [Anaerolineae bacterium]|nr:translation initiation factor IF-3 [Anaerolineae bacterium]